MMHGVERLFVGILNMSLTAGIVILLVAALRLFLRKSPKIFSYLLWSVVLFRLLCPVSFSSAVSFLGMMRMPVAKQGQMDYIPENIALTEQPVVNIPAPASGEPVQVSLPAPAVGDSVNPMQILLAVGIGVWMSGILIMTIYSIVTYRKLHGKLKEAVWERDNIYYVPGIATPFVCGIFSPRIYLPGRFLNCSGEAEEKEKRYILLHEQIHIRRRDYIWRIVSYFALCIHWFNPLVWFAFFLSGKDMEMSCDEAVIRTLGSGVKKEYSAALLSLASGRKITLDMPLAFGEGETGSRIKNILRYKKPAQAAIGIVAVICAAAVIVLAANPRNGGEGEDGIKTSGENTGDSADSSAADAAEVYYGIVSYVDVTGENASLTEVVTVPGMGDIIIPEAEEIYPYIEREYFTGPEEGDLLQITFPEGEAVFIQETYPAAFSIQAESIVVMGEGFILKRTDSGSYQFTVPWGLVRDAKEEDMIEIYYYPDNNGEEAAGEAGRVLLASVPVLSVDAAHYDVWVELSTEQVSAFLAGFSNGIDCEIVNASAAEDANALRSGNDSDLEITMPENEQAESGIQENEAAGEGGILTIDADGSISDGTYRVYVRSISRSARGIDRYYTNLADAVEEDASQPFLPFAADCNFLTNQKMDSRSYAETSFDTFADLTQEALFMKNPAVLLTFEDGAVVEAVLEDYYGAGISYMALPPDMWYDNVQEMTKLSAQELLDTHYTLVKQAYMDVADSDGFERIEVYTGDIGGSENGIVFFKDAAQEDVFTALYTASAHTSRAGWNNIYLGYQDGYGFIMTIHIENRIDFGEYCYHVFRLSESGAIQEIAGSSFDFDNRGIPYDDDLFRQWTENLGRYLAGDAAVLLLSTQDGELRTEADMASEAAKYTYEALKPSGN